MKMYELEKKINEKLEELGLTKKENQTYYEDVARQVSSVVRDIVKFELFGQRGDTIYTTTYKGNVIIKTYAGFKDIVVKVKRIKGDNKYVYGRIQYYYLNKVEIDYPNMKETLDKWYDTNKKLEDEKNQAEKDKINTFIKFLQDKDMTLEDFELYNNIFKTYSYKIKKLLKKE